LSHDFEEFAQIFPCRNFQGIVLYRALKLAKLGPRHIRWFSREMAGLADFSEEALPLEQSFRPW